MLTRSFIFAKGLTDELERSLWQHGILDWETLRRHRPVAAEAIGEARSQKLLAAVAEAQEAYDRQDLGWFKAHWPVKETWRLWRGFCTPERTGLLDIETTGRTIGFDQITVIGLSDGTQERAFVADRPQVGDEALSAFPEALRTRHLLVTFNGEGFDLPFIERHFKTQSLRFDLPHIDLMWVGRACGLTGGLKDMEKQLGIVRDGEIANMRGNEAITLWGAWKNGDAAAYRKLVTYCKADCTNLRAFADAVYERRWAAVHTPYARTVDLDASRGEQLSLF
jgi:hypothetical protein